MTYEEFRASVLAKVNLAKGYSAARAPRDDGKTDRVVAAAAVVLSQRGPKWCLENPKAYANAVQSSLSGWVKIGIALAGIFTGGGSVWISLIAAVIPAVLELLQARSQVAGAIAGSSGDFDAAFAAHAQLALGAK